VSNSGFAVELNSELVAHRVENVLDEGEARHPLERTHEAHLVLFENKHQVVLAVLVEWRVADEDPGLVEGLQVQ